MAKKISQLTEKLAADVESPASLWLGMAYMYGTPSSPKMKLPEFRKLVSDVINVKDYGAVGNGTTDDTDAIQAALTAASGGHAVVEIPAGNWLITGTLVIPSGVTLRGVHAYQGGSRLYTEITDGSPVLSLDNIYYWCIRDLYIEPKSGTVENCTGISAANLSNYWYMENVHVRKCAVGYSIDGFIGTAVNCWADFCTLGWRGTNLNSCNLNLQIEGGTNGIELETCATTRITGIVEGQTGSAISIEDCDQLKIDNIYVEIDSPTVTRLLSVGETSQCNRVMISGGSFTARDHDLGEYPIVFDRVSALDVDGTFIFSDSTLRGHGILITSNASDIRMNPVVEGSFIQDNSEAVRQPTNFFSDPFLYRHDAGFNGSAPSTTACSISLESAQGTPNIRTGKEAIRLTATSGVTLSRAVYEFDTSIAAELAGKAVTLGVWVYTADHANFAVPDYPTALKLYPVLSLYDGSSFTSTSGGALRPGAWTFATINKTLNAGTTSLKLYAAVVNSGDTTTSNGSEYIILDSVYLCEGTVPSGRLMTATPLFRLSDAYTASNVTTDRALDADADTLAQVADVLGTLINDLKTQGVIG